MLLAVNYALANGFDLTDTDVLKEKFGEYRGIISKVTRIKTLGDLRRINVEEIVRNLV